MACDASSDDSSDDDDSSEDSSEDLSGVSFFGASSVVISSD